MTSPALRRCVDNILITYDENKAKADILTHSLGCIYEAQIKHNCSIGEKNTSFFFRFSKPEKLKSYYKNIIKYMHSS